jgi:uncharacterized protein YbcI
MHESNDQQSTVARQIALTALASYEQRTGHKPKSVTVVLVADTLVITLHGALSPAELLLAQSLDGAAQVRESHRELFANSADALRQEIKRIIGVEVKEPVADVEPMTGSMMQVFTTGTMVQMFQLAHGLPTDTWSGTGDGEQATKQELTETIVTGAAV